MPRITFFAYARLRSGCIALAATLVAATTGLAATPPADVSERLDNPPQAARTGPEPSAAMVAPFVTTPQSIVDEMLRLANAGPGDFVIDLGSGDGRLVLAAVTRFGVRGGLGVDLDPRLVQHANAKAQEAGVTDRAQFYVRDLFDTDIHGATVVTVYLLPGIMGRLQDKLLAELPAGSRVVSHDYPFPSWPMDRVRTFDVPEKNDYTGRRSTSVYLYTVPARAPTAAPARS
jgi:SAM-dependent methyltransferase